MTTHNHRLTIDMPEKEHKKLKAMAAFFGLSIKELVLSCLNESLFNENGPNVETMKAIIETKEGKNIIRCEDFNDFTKKIGFD